MDAEVLADLHRVGAEIAAWELRTGRRLPAGSLLLATCTASLSAPPVMKPAPSHLNPSDNHPEDVRG